MIRSGRVAFWLLSATILFVSSFVASARAAPTPTPSPCQLRGDETTEGADLWAEVAAQVPTFAGMYVDEDTRTLYVLVTDQGQSLTAAVHALQIIVRSPELCEFTPVALPAKYSYSQLKAWDDRMGAALSVRGIVSSGIDEAHNRLEVGVEDLATQGHLVQAQLIDLDIPLEAVKVVQEEPIEYLLPETRGTGPLLVGIAIVVVVGLVVLAKSLAIRRKGRSHKDGKEIPVAPPSD